MTSLRASLRFELFYALHHFLTPRGPGDGGEPHRALARPVLEAHEALGGAALFWIIANDALAALPATADFETIRQAVLALDARTFARRVIGGMLHSEERAQDILAGHATVPEATAALPPVKREWLSHIGLYPFRTEAPVARAIAAIRSDPEAAKQLTDSAITAFWDAHFGELWAAMASVYAASTSRLQGMLDCHDLSYCFDALTLPAEFDVARGEVRARRGGYRLALAETEAIYLMPSAFNGWRFWTVDAAGDRTIAYFPVFDEDLSVGVESGAGSEPASEPRLDLVFRALGKDVRLGIVDLLAERPRTAGELAESLGMPKSTLSHHLFLLREADLLESRSGEGGRRLSLRKQPFERMTPAALARFFPPASASDR